MWRLPHMMSGESSSKQLTQNIWWCLGLSDSYHISFLSTVRVWRQHGLNNSWGWLAWTCRLNLYMHISRFRSFLFLCSLSLSHTHTHIHNHPWITITQSSRILVYSSSHRGAPDGNIIRTIFFSSKQTKRSGRGEKTFIENIEYVEYVSVYLESDFFCADKLAIVCMNIWSLFKCRMFFLF